MAKLEVSAIAVVSVAGKEIKHQISDIKLEQAIDEHHLLQVRVRQVGTGQKDSEFGDPSDFTGFLGESISLSLKPTGGLIDESRELAFTGVVTEIRLENSIDGVNTVLITGRSPTIALDGARRDALFHEQSASDLIGATVRKYPITVGTISDSKGTLKFCVQYRETDYEFVMRLAGGCGLFAFYDGKEFHLTQAKGSDQEELIWRESLGQFGAGMGIVSQEFKSRLYNYEQHNTYEQDSQSVTSQASLSDLAKISPEASKKVYGDSGVSTSATTVSDLQSLDDILDRERSRARGRMVRCIGESIVPSVKVGRCVKIKGMADLDGSYWVQKVVHQFEESGKYHNEFVCTPLDLAFAQSRSALRPSTELQSAVVVDNNDPDKLGRIKVNFPWSGGEETPWVRFVSVHAGKDHGWYSVPEVGDEVLVGFEHGNPALPVALGAVYNAENSPAGDTQTNENNVKAFSTKGGNQILLCDEGGKEEIHICTKDAKSQIVLNLAGPGIGIKCEGDISLEGKNITLKGENIKLDGSSAIEAKAGADLKLEASGNLVSKGGANCNLEGGAITT